MAEPRKYKYEEYLEKGYKDCENCGELPIEKFYLRKPPNKTPSFVNRCNDCENKRRIKSDRKKYGSEKHKKLWHRYGLTKDKYESMIAAQEGKCAICNDYKDLCVDHCHSTGKIRGLLCNQCNTSLGSLGDNPCVVLSAFIYLLNNGVSY